LPSLVPSEGIAVSRAKGNEAMSRCPGERKFFNILNAELRKAIHFFEKAMQEFAIREERVREGYFILKKPDNVMVSDRWNALSKSLYTLYKDLLLLETYAIMTYCSFSKILKKHDKITGYDTRVKFMTTYVNKANFARYVDVMEMIKRCEKLYNEVEQHLLKEGKKSLHEDERLFINMIQNLNKHVLDTAAQEGSPVGNSGHEASSETCSLHQEAESSRSSGNNLPCSSDTPVEKQSFEIPSLPIYTQVPPSNEENDPRKRHLMSLLERTSQGKGQEIRDGSNGYDYKESSVAKKARTTDQ